MANVAAADRTRRSYQNPLRLAAAVGLLMMVAGLSHAQSSVPQTFDIPAGSLMEALDRFGEQSGLQVTYDPELLKGKRAPAVNGKLGADAALAQLLKGSGLGSGLINDRTVIIKTAAPAVPSKQVPPERPAMRAKEKNVSVEEPTTLEAMTITGTRIRGGTSPSPVVTIDAERIREEGFTDLGEVIRSIPQNYIGGQNPGVINGQAGNVANANVTGGSSLNLRGLGPDATLTLLNGRRMSYGGLYQSVDISAIPVEAVQRIEIVADGASAIYGSDAVGGVGNVILKRDFEGVTIGTRYGAAKDGGLTTREYTATAGATWSSGGLIATYKDASVDPIYADQRNYTQFFDDPTTIYGGSDLSSGLISAFQMLGDRAELHVDAFRTTREQRFSAGRPTFVSSGAPETTTWLISPSVEFSLAGDWKATVGGTWGRDDVVTNSTITRRATGVSSVSSNISYLNNSRTYEIGAEGPLFAMGGGNARLAVGAGYRLNDFRQHNYLTNVISTSGGESSRFAYVEANFPLIAPESGGTRAQRLIFTAAMRGEDYDSFGRVATPKLGLIYGPSANFTLKASWGKSFKAPTLVQRNGPQYVYLDPASYFGATGYPAGSTVMSSTGSNPDLSPERARTWTGSLAFHPQALPNLEAELSLFDIQYTERVVSPIANTTQALSNPDYRSFVTYSPTAEQLATILSDPRVQFINLSGGAYNSSTVIAFVFGQDSNATEQRIRGIDLTAGYGFDMGEGRLTVRGSASWLDSTQLTIADGDRFDLAGNIFYPARLKSRIGAVWSQGRFTASGFANHTGGVTNRVDGVKTDSFTTFDATLRYGIGERGGIWGGWELALSAQNIFNIEPPAYATASVITPHFDSTNYSAIGRFLSASISKHW